MENNDKNLEIINEDDREIHYHMNIENPTPKDQFVTTLVVGGAGLLLAGGMIGAITLSEAIVTKIADKRLEKKKIKEEVAARMKAEKES